MGIMKKENIFKLEASLAQSLLQIWRKIEEIEKNWNFRVMLNYEIFKSSEMSSVCKISFSYTVTNTKFESALH